MGYLNFAALTWASRDPAPESIPLSGDDAKIQKRRYFSSRAEFSSPDGRMLVKFACPEGLSGLYWHNNESGGFEVSIPKKSFRAASISITHYFRKVEINYTSALSFFWGRITFLHRRAAFKMAFDRWLFGRKSLEEASRIEVLRWCHRKSVYENFTVFSRWTFLSEKYGDNWIFHPQKDSLLSYYKWVMLSLDASGDLKKANDGANFSLEPKAIQTLVEFDADLQRHNDSRKQQHRMSGLTSALVFVGLVQVIVTALSVITN